MSQGWGQQPNKPGQGWGQQGTTGNTGQQGWGQQGTTGQQGWGQQGTTGQQGWGQQGVSGQGQQGWGQQGTTGQQGWGQQGTTGQQGWGQQGTTGQQGWGQQGTTGQQGWGQQGTGQQSWGTGQGTGQQGWGNQGIVQPVGGLINPNQTYVIESALDNDKILDISQGNDNTKYKLILWTRNNGNNQKFRFREVGGKYQIVSLLGACVEVPNSSGANGVQLLAGQVNNTPNEYFEIVPSNNHKGAFHFRSFCGKFLDVCEGKDSKGTPIIQWDFNGGKNQTWYLRPA